MRYRWIIAGLVAALGLVADTARGQDAAWDKLVARGQTGENWDGGRTNDDPQIWAPIGAYQHDGSGLFTGFEFVLLNQPRNLGNQPLAYRGVLVNFGVPFFPGILDSPPLQAVPPGTFLGSAQEALNTEDLGRRSWAAGTRFTLGYRMENGWSVSLSWLHLFDTKYSGGAGPQGPDFPNTGTRDVNTFLFSPVYNFSADFVGRNPFPNPPFFVNPTQGIWNAATDMTILYTQRFDNWDLAGRFPVYESENARSYAIAGGRFSWIWERFQWRTSKPELINDGTSFQFQTTGDSTARYLNTQSQRMYGPMIGVGHEVMLYGGPIGAFGVGFEGTGAALLNITKQRVKYIREDERTQAKRAWIENTLIPNVNLSLNLTYQPFDGMSLRVGYNAFNYFGTYYMKEPVSFNVGALDPAYGNEAWRLLHGVNAGFSYTW